MAATEEARHQLYQRLEVQLGHEEATTLMDHLPYGGWLNLASKEDVVRLAERIDVRFAQMDARLTQSDARMTSLREHMDDQFGAVDARFGSFREYVDGRFDRVELLFEKQGETLQRIVAQKHLNFFMAILSLLAVLGGFALGTGFVR